MKRPFASYRPIGPIYNFNFNATNNTQESIDEFFRNTAIFKSKILAKEYKIQIYTYLPSVEKENINSLQTGKIRVAAISRYFKNGYKKFTERTAYRNRQINIPSKSFTNEDINPENLDGAPGVFIVKTDGSNIPQRFTTRYGLYFMKSTLIYKNEIIQSGFKDAEYKIEIPEKQFDNTPDSIENTTYDLTLVGLEESTLTGLSGQVISFTSEPIVNLSRVNKSKNGHFKIPKSKIEDSLLYGARKEDRGEGQIVQVIAEPTQELINLQ
jgi:hypothetical protein